MSEYECISRAAIFLMLYIKRKVYVEVQITNGCVDLRRKACGVVILRVFGLNLACSKPEWQFLRYAYPPASVMSNALLNESNHWAKRV